MLQQLIPILEDMCRIQQSMTCKSGCLELEIRLTLPRWLDKSGVLHMCDDLVCETYTETIYSLCDKNNSKIRVRRYSHDNIEMISKYKIMKRRLNNYDIDVVLSYESRVRSLPSYPPYKSVTCDRYTRSDTNTLTDIKVVDNTPRVEIEILGGDYVGDLTHILGRLSSILYHSECILYPRVYRVMSDIHKNILHKYPLPEHLCYRDLGTLVGPWMVTHKLDGERRFLCIVSYGIYSMDRSGKIYCISDSAIDILYHSVLDCEYYDGKYYIIDCIISMSVNVSHLYLELRLDSINKIHSVLPECVMPKEYYTCNSARMSTVIATTMSSDMYDGIILIRADMDYYHTQYKIKKISTCDMRYNGTYLISSDNVEYHASDTTSLTTGTIYECVYVRKTDSWDVIRSRVDKLNANYSSIIHSAVTSVVIRDIDKYRYRIMSTYHDSIKRIILSTHYSKGILLDIGSGRGKDVDKWHKYSRVYCVEPDGRAAKSLHKKIRDQRCENVVIIQCRLSNYKMIRRHISGKVTNVSIFFSYMMMDIYDDRSLCKILDEICSESCTVDIITTSADKMRSIVDSRYVREINKHAVSVTIPKTRIKENMEFLTDTANICNMIVSHNFMLWLKSDLRSHFTMNIRQDISSAYTYLGFNRGVCRDTPPTSESCADEKFIYVRLDNGFRVASYASRYNVVSHTGRVSCRDITLTEIL